jgi:hypothetical protein
MGSPSSFDQRRSVGGTPELNTSPAASVVTGKAWGIREITGLQGSLALAPQSWLLRALNVVLLILWKEFGDRPSFGLTSGSSLEEYFLGYSPELDAALVGR